MGVLETRLMSYKRVFVLDAVEDKIPGAPRYDALLPDTLRRLLALPDSRERDLVAAYNLYRLFFGAEEITVFYRTGSPGSGLFEDKPGRSRFVEQLLWEEEKRLGRVLRPGEPPVSILRLPPCPIPASDPAVPVTGEVADRLAAYLETQKLSASFFDAYLACPLRFFYRYLSPLSPLAEVAEEGDRAAFGEVVHDVLREFFVLSNIDAGFEEQAGCGVFTFRTKLHCRMQTAQMTVLVREDNFSTLTAIPLAADKNSRLAVAEYLTRVNFNMRNGNFELDMETGEIRFKTYVHVGGGRPDRGATRLAVMLPFLMLDRFGDGLLEVLFGFKSPREAFESVQRTR